MNLLGYVSGQINNENGGGIMCMVDTCSVCGSALMSMGDCSNFNCSESMSATSAAPMSTETDPLGLEYGKKLKSSTERRVKRCPECDNITLIKQHWSYGKDMICHNCGYTQETDVGKSKRLAAKEKYREQAKSVNIAWLSEMLLIMVENGISIDKLSPGLVLGYIPVLKSNYENIRMSSNRSMCMQNSGCTMMGSFDIPNSKIIEDSYDRLFYSDSRYIYTTSSLDNMLKYLEETYIDGASLTISALCKVVAQFGLDDTVV